MASVIRLYVDHPLVAGQSVPLTVEQSHYLFRVMRKGVGEKLEVFFNDDVEGANTPFLGKSLSSGGGYSERTKDIFDKEVYHLIEDAYETSKTVLRENKDVMINMVDKLMEKEILIPGDF